MRTVSITVQRLPGAADLPLPRYATEGAAGMDLAAAVTEPVTLEPGQRILIPTGLIIAIPSGYEGQVRARSGIALKQGLGMANAPGTIDCDYRGEIQVLLINWSHEPQTIRRGDRIAQLIIAPIARADITEVETIDSTPRGSGGFGHTGT